MSTPPFAPDSVRAATVHDIPAIFHVRTSVRENALTLSELEELGITADSIAEMILSGPCAWVAEADGQVVGFSMVDLESACLFAAFVLPAYEGRGLGTQLIAAAEKALFVQHELAWLETAKSSRAAGLYRHLGWGHERDVRDGDIRLEKRRV